MIPRRHGAPSEPCTTRRSRLLLCWSAVIAGALLTQALVLWPSLSGRRVLLPLDVLASPNLYLTSVDPRAALADMSNSDPVVQYEPWRRFAAAEFRAGRIPLWNPYGFAGAPFALWPKYSPFNVLYYAWPATSTLVFMHLAVALVACAGAYVFFRRSLRVAFWPAAVGAWAYPLSGHFVLWLAFPVPSVTAWLPWLLWAAERTARRPAGRGPFALALLTGVVLVSGLTDWALLSLFAASLFAVWCAWRAHRRRATTVAFGVGASAAAVAVGLMLATPYLLPMIDYVRTGSRYATRLDGRQDRPPLGPRVLPQVVLPDVYGTLTPGERYLLPSNRREGAASAYAGLWLTLVAAPWSLARRPRLLLLPWLVLALLGVSATLGVPGLVQVFQVPFVNLVSYNRFAFATGFSLMCLAVIGLDNVARGTSRRASAFLSVVLLVGTGAFTVWHRVHLGPDIEPSLRAAAVAGAWMVACGLVMAVALALGAGRYRTFRLALGVLAVAELVGFGKSEIHHGDPALDYPALPKVTESGGTGAERVLGVACLPPNVLSTHGVRDVRGYDAVDPRRYLDLLLLARDPAADRHSPPFARSLLLAPRYTAAGAGLVDLPGVLDMLGVRRLILPPAVLGETTYRVFLNPEALPPVFVPKAVSPLSDGESTLARLKAPDFDARDIAFAEGLPPSNDVRGHATIVQDRPDRVDVDVDMETPGLLVRSTLWDEGWRATVDGHTRPVLRVNHAIQGVQVQRGRAHVAFTYEPASFGRGVGLMIAGFASLGLFALWRAGLFALWRARAVAA